MEFRSKVDDAWYAVKILTEGDGGEWLRVKFDDFKDEDDEVYKVKDLTSINHVMKFRSRFRAVSIQVQDSECPNVVEGTLVCAAVSVLPNDCRFYDAVVNQVKIFILIILTIIVFSNFDEQQVTIDCDFKP
ncbi:uncharacterized protein LOC133737481 [Rosa rugosa]|uniref:uncharacterized protein LOC133737481 n=1 Tax=Rosa rugosa TaxID=74645 RepID=UPI002B40E8FB|nr:uncharacterized protein LOC133737481 [Rosa rugosa]